MRSATQRRIAWCLSLGWTFVWLLPLALFASGQGFCSDCSCCADLFGGRVACVRSAAPPAGLEMTCDDEKKEAPSVPHLLGKVRAGVVSSSIESTQDHAAARVSFLDRIAANRDAAPPEIRPPRS
ncbi:MAG: hypothetical protein K8J08_18215 [Thermoanaerobaculia bacterium]|nr:hypothetical protein [Thermoanaerobaculia bacterium]